MFVNGKENYFIMLYKHKSNLQHKPTIQLLNPAKNELGRISKTILDNISVNLWNLLYVNQWKNTKIIDRYISIDYKQHYRFIMFGIKDFYLPVLKQL